MSRAWRIPLAFAVLTVIAIGGGAAALWWVGGERGTAWLAGFVAARAGPALEIGRVEGALRERVVLRDLVLTTPGFELEISEAGFVLAPAALLRGVLALEELALGHVTYRQRSAPPAAEAGPGVAERIGVVVERGSVDALTLELGDRVLQVGPTGLAVEWRAPQLLITDLAGTAEGVTVDGGLELELGPATTLVAEVEWAGELDGQTFRGRGTLAGTWPELELHHELIEPFAAVADGRVDLDDVPAVSLELRWNDLAWPSVGAVASPAGRLQLDGTLEDYAFTGSGQLIARDLPELPDLPLDFELSGSGRRAVLSLRSLLLEHPEGEVEASGQLSVDAAELSLALDARALNPAVVASQWPGRLDVTGRLQGTWGAAPQWRLADIALDGELRGQPVRGRGAIAYDSAGWRLEAVALDSGDNRARLSGRVDTALDLAVFVDVPNLSGVWPGLAGRLTGEARLRGPLDEPAVVGRLRADALVFGEYRLDRFELSGDLGVAAGTPMTVEAAAEGFRYADTRVATLSAQLRGTTSQHALTASATAEEWSATVRAAGGADASGRGWEGRVEALALDQALLGQWRLEAPTRLAVRPGALALDTACVARADSRICGTAQLGEATEDTIQLVTRNMRLETLAPLLPPELQLRGAYQASLSLAGVSSGARRGVLSIAGDTTTIVLEQPGQQPFQTEVRAVTLAATLDDRRLAVDGRISGHADSVATLSAEIGDLTQADPPLSGQLRVAWPDLGFLALLSPDVGSVAGRLEVDLVAAGTLNAPRFDGQARLGQGQILVPEWGLSIDAIEADARSVDGEPLEFVASGQVGDGRLDVEGTTLLDPQAGWPTRMTLRGDAIQAVRLPEAEIFLSPDLDVRVELPEIRVNGTMHVPRAQIRLEELPAQAVTPSPDVVLHDVEQLEPARPLRLYADLLVTLGDNVRYSGSGLSVALAGDMRVQYEVGRVVDTQGIVTLSGSYDAYGQSLGLERGQLLFNGSLDDPTLDVRAVRRIETQTVGVQLTGTLQAPQTRLFSEPPLSEADALAYLLLGRPLTASGDEQTATLESAAISMGLQQALPAVQRIGQSLGFDEFSVQTTASDAGALMAGKYLGPRVYLRYTYGLFNRIGGLLLRFRLNDRLSLETRSGDEKSMDLLYTVERE